MKKIILIFVFLLQGIILLAQSNTLTFVPATPKPGDEIKFIYNNNKNFFSTDDSIYMRVALINSGGAKGDTIQLEKTNAGFEGKYKIPLNTDLMVAVVQNDFNLVDANNNNGYFVHLYDSTNNESKASQFAYANFISKNFRFIYLKTDKPKSIKLFDELFAKYPSEKINYIDNYLMALSCIKDKKTKQNVDSTVKFWFQHADTTDKQLGTIIESYKEINDKVSAAKYLAIAKTKFPKGEVAFDDALDKMRDETDFNKQTKIADSLLKVYGDKKKFDIHNTILISLNERADYDNFVSYWKKISSNQEQWAFPTLINAISNLVRLNKYDVANNLIKDCMYYNFFAIERTTNENAYKDNFALLYILSAKIEEATNGNHYLAMDNLYKAVGYYPIKKWSDESLTQYFNTAVNAETTYPMQQSFVENAYLKNFDVPAIDSLLKQQFVKANPFGNVDSSFNLYMTKLNEKKAKQKKDDLKMMMVDYPAPNLIFKDLTGKNVLLSSLKGKTVVLNFWATYCSPCIANFPYYQKIIDHYKNNSNVVFLFVTTKDNSPNKIEKINKLTKKSNYNFNLVLDENSTAYEAFQLPFLGSKIIIDKRGNVRFEVINYPKDKNQMVDQLKNMIDTVNEF